MYYLNMTIQTHPTYLFIRKQHTLHRVEFKHICYIQAEGNYCYIKLLDGKKFASKISLRQLLTKLPDSHFARIHKSFVVNLTYLEKIDTKERQVTVAEETLPIGRTFISGLTERMLIL